MWPAAYWPTAYWFGDYWPKTGAEPPEPPVTGQNFVGFLNANVGHLKVVNNK